MADSDVIEFECPRCLATVRVDREQSGNRVDCPECEGSLLVPSQSTSPDLFDDIFDSKPVEQAAIPSNATPDSKTDELPAELEVIDEDDLLNDLVVPGPANVTEKTIADTADADPFKVDPDAPIKLDGMGDVYSHDDVYGIKCNICDTRIHVRPEQAGSTIQCPECYSNVLVKPQSGAKTKPPKWQSDGRGQFTTKPDEELKLSDPVARPTTNIDESFGLAPVTEDMLAPKPKTRDESPGDDNDNGLSLAPLPDEIEPIEEPPLLELMDDDEPAAKSDSGLKADSEIKLESATPRPASPKKPPTKTDSSAETKSDPDQKGSRRARYEASQRRQSAAEAGTVYRPTREETQDSSASKLDRFPEFETGSLFAATIEMLRSPGLSWRVAIAIALMCFGSIMGIVMWPIYVPAAEDLEEAQTGVQKIWIGVQWTLFGVIPYMIGLAILWYTSGFIFRESALGNRQVKSWKSKGGNETLATFLVFGFGFFIGGLPAAFMQYLIMPLRMILSPLLLLGAWHGQSAFSIVNVDAFKNMMKQSSHWISFYIFMAIMGLIGLFGGLLFEFRRAIPYFAINAAFSIIGVLIVAVITLAFAAVCGWNCGWVVEELEESS